MTVRAIMTALKTLTVFRKRQRIDNSKYFGLTGLAHLNICEMVQKVQTRPCFTIIINQVLKFKCKGE